MRRPMPIHPVCPRRSPCASPCVLTWMKVVSRARKLRPADLLRIWAAAVGRLSGSVAEKLGESKLVMRFACRGWLCSDDS